MCTSVTGFLNVRHCNNPVIAVIGYFCEVDSVLLFVSTVKKVLAQLLV